MKKWVAHLYSVAVFIVSPMMFSFIKYYKNKQSMFTFSESILYQLVVSYSLPIGHHKNAKNDKLYNLTESNHRLLIFYEILTNKASLNSQWKLQQKMFLYIFLFLYLKSSFVKFEPEYFKWPPFWNKTQ